MSDYFDGDNEELLKDFYLEAEQQVEKLEQNVLAMEDDPSDKEAIDEIFRAAHTLKGGAATVHMQELAEFTHAVEDLLDAIRNNEVIATSPIVDAILQSLDVIKAMLEERKNGNIYAEDVSLLKVTLHDMAKPAGAKPVKVPVIKASVMAQASEALQSTGGEMRMNSAPSNEMSDADIAEMQELENGDDGCVHRVRITFDENNPMNSVGGIQIFAVLKRCGQVLRTCPDFESLYEDNFFPVVDYYVLSTLSAAEISRKSQLTDVTLGSIAVLISDLQHIIQASEVSNETNVQVATLSALVEEADAVTPVAAGAKSEGVAKKGSGKKAEQSQIIRVDSKRIDTLLNLVSEIVITKGTFNQISGQFNSVMNSFYSSRSQFSVSVKSFAETLHEQIERAMRGELTLAEVRKYVMVHLMEMNTHFDGVETDLKASLAKFRTITTDLARTTGELHNAVLKIRMVPVDQVFQRFPRLVRDLAKTLDKSVRLEIIGGETEMDKIVTEELFDPLMHCVRNSMDHGLEQPAARRESGKNEQGLLTLRASNQGNMVVIQISDDGKGIDVEAIKAKALERGLITAGKTMSTQDTLNLIMEPGFSTAKQITDLSGRGVGLDVVRKSIEKLNGEINIWSEWGKGSTFTIKLPLTLAIIQGLMVAVGESVFVIPITAVLESFRVKTEEIMLLDGHEVFNVREDVVSILQLSKLFQLSSNPITAEHSFIVVVGSEDKKIGLMVDALIGEEDVVIKPLRDKYTATPGVAGATILGDGSVSLIVDVSQLLTLGLQQELDNREVGVAIPHEEGV